MNSWQAGLRAAGRRGGRGAGTRAQPPSATCIPWKDGKAQAHAAAATHSAMHIGTGGSGPGAGAGIGPAIGKRRWWAGAKGGTGTTAACRRCWLDKPRRMARTHVPGGAAALPLTVGGRRDGRRAGRGWSWPVAGLWCGRWGVAGLWCGRIGGLRSWHEWRWDWGVKRRWARRVKHRRGARAEVRAWAGERRCVGGWGGRDG